MKATTGKESDNNPRVISNWACRVFAILALALTGRAAADSITVDPKFNPPFFASPTTGVRAVLLPDGKYVVFFNVDTNAEENTSGLVRYNADGTLDTNFRFKSDYGFVGAVAPTGDGRLIISASKTTYGVSEPSQHSKIDVLRLNADGSIDSTFGPAGSTDGGEIRVISIDPQGRILVGGLFTAFNNTSVHGIVRLMPDGSVDANFGPVQMTCPQSPFGGSGCGVWASPVVDANNKILIAGDFTSVNGVLARCVARLNSNGTTDTTFNASGFTPTGFFANPSRPWPIRGLGIQSNGSIIIGGRFNSPGTAPCNSRVPLVRLNGTTGIRDTSYVTVCLSNSSFNSLRNLLVQPDDKVVAVDVSVWRFNTNGSLDGSFHNPTFGFLDQSNHDPFFDFGEAAFNIAFADGGTKLFVGGLFAGVDNVPGERWCAAKFNAADGTLDPTFTTSGRTGEKIEPNSFLRNTTNGSTLISFSNSPESLLHLPEIPHGLGRLNADGTFDTSFDPINAFDRNFIASGFTVLPDASFLVTGSVSGFPKYYHLFADATQDTTFTPDSSVQFSTALPRDDGELAVSFFDVGLLDPNSSTNLNAQAVIDGTVVRLLTPTGLADSSFKLDSTIVMDMQKRDPDGTFVSKQVPPDPTVGIYTGCQVLALMLDPATGKIHQALFGYVSSSAATCDLQGNCQSVYKLVLLNDTGTRVSDLTDPTDATKFQEHDFPVQLSYFATSVTDRSTSQSVFVPHLFVPTELPVKQAINVLDNKVVLMGSFTKDGVSPVAGIFRINPNGTRDSNFSIGTGAQWTVTPETAFRHPSIDNLQVGLDDKLLVTGTFEAFNGVSAPGIINLNPDGSVDSSFTSNPPVKRQKFDYQPAYLARQKDGSFLLSGPYSRATDNNSPSFLHLLLPPGPPTPAGTNVATDDGSVGGASDITARFTSVTSPGSTSVSQIDPNWAGQLPPGYVLSGTNLSFEVYTTATYSGPIILCFKVPSLDDPAFAAARILHNPGSGLVDVTSSKDAATKTICATVSSLSPFVIARPPYQATILPPINADGSSAFTVKRGVAPIKFSLAVGGNPTCALPTATIAVTRIDGADPVSVNESVYVVPADSGSNFRIDSCQYVYNLNSTGLGVGKYRVDIIISGQVAGSATFQLK